MSIQKIDQSMNGQATQVGSLGSHDKGSPDPRSRACCPNFLVLLLLVRSVSDYRYEYRHGHTSDR